MFWIFRSRIEDEAASVLPSEALCMIAHKYALRVSRERCLAPEAILAEGEEEARGLVYRFQYVEEYVYKHVTFYQSCIMHVISFPYGSMWVGFRDDVCVFAAAPIGIHMRKSIAACLVLMRRHGCLLDGDSVVCVSDRNHRVVRARARYLLHGSDAYWNTETLGCAIM